MMNCIISNDVQLRSKQEVDFPSLLLQLKENMCDRGFLMPVRRGHVLEDALRSMQRSSFSPTLRLNVQVLLLLY